MSAHKPSSTAVLELLVRNHPGVMSHVCGLFSRRAYNVEGIVCMPVADGRTSRIYLQVCEENRLDQITKQIRKLSDVREVIRHGGDHPVFVEIAGMYNRAS